MASLTDYLSGQLARITVIKSFNREAYETERGEKEIKEYYIAQRKENIAEFLQSSVGSAIHIVPDTIMILVGIYMLNAKALTPAGWIVFYAYANQVFSFFSDKISLWIQVKTYQGNMNRLSELFSAPEEGAKEYAVEEVSAEDIVFDGVSFSYGDHDILSDASFTFPKNKFTAIFGPSGTGKTTILKLIERIYEPTAGRILQNGYEIGDYKLENWRRQFSYVKQDTPMISGTIRDNILYGVESAITDEQIMSAASEIRADSFIENCPGGLDYDVGQFGDKLSGGQLQRLAIARAFMKNPDYLLMDEATSGVDMLKEAEIIARMKENMRGKTVIMISHNMNLVKDADHIVVIAGGQVEAEGSVDEMMQTSSTFQAMLGNTDAAPA